jgi:hypothetical protein
MPVDKKDGIVGASHSAITNVRALRAALLDTHLSLFTRYRAMFALRNIGTPEAIDALCAGFDDDSALFKLVDILFRPRLVHQSSRNSIVSDWTTLFIFIDLIDMKLRLFWVNYRTLIPFPHSWKSSKDQTNRRWCGTKQQRL